MRALGLRALDMLIDHVAAPSDSTPVPARTAGGAAALLRDQPVPDAAVDDPAALLDELHLLLRDGNAHPDRPGFLAFVPSPGTFTGVLGAALATGFAVPTGWRLTGPVASAIESATVGWLVELLGLSEGTSGLFVPGGSLANLTALTAARDARAGEEPHRATAYVSDQAHFSVRRALHVLGLGADRVRILPSDRAQRLSLAALAERVGQDRRQGSCPFLVVASAGTTATGAVDPLPELARFCAEEGLWLHVDGAYGAPAALTHRGRRALAGLGLADSVTVDAHKWLFQPAETSCVLLREPAHLRRSFGVELPSYLAADGTAPASGAQDDGVDFLQWGVQHTREFRALRLWLSLKTFGADAFRSAIDRGLDTAEEIARHIDASPGLAVVTGPALAVVTFRPLPRGPGPAPTPQEQDRAVDEVCRALMDEGHALVMAVTVAGRRVFRLCTINPRIETAQLRRVVDHIGALWQTRTAAPPSRRPTPSGQARAEGTAG
ncbi:pyridoxal phosphate-dependent decarboxylase family protein [Streptomyces sp. NPDC059096]|uniref:pyridoxal phosphate-dependent decarboxylase family protein n=1 Tax=Streptomyces sp. NPDC059096 TaxID=3346727 RepID=UPI003680EDE6